MIGWTSEQAEFRSAIRKFVEAELAPRREALEFGDEPPYEFLRSYYATFGVGESAAERFDRSLEASSPNAQSSPTTQRRDAAETLIPIVEFARHSPGVVTALGVSVGLTAGAILRAGTREQKIRWARDLITLKAIGAWAITEPDSGSDAFGSMRATARPEGDGWVLNGAKTFITNGPYADTIVFIAKIDDGRPWPDREIASFVLDAGMPGLTQSRRLRKMGLHSSPTGEISATDVRVGLERRLLGDRQAVNQDRVVRARSSAKATFATERASVAAMALGVIERCLELSVEYASTRTQFGRRIGDFQLIQAKLARMEIARLNVENLVLRHIADANAGRRPSLAAASAMKLYSASAAASVANDAVQIFGGNGYMAEHPVEQMFRDARVLQIYGGTDEIQTAQIARNLLAPDTNDARS